ncbi:MAG: hypothetical protein E3J72_08045 [Planctomycetota bacterium]|nr:MAG: hypothetical protein E3J72_08045 [Planctomycetota bacterium]
MKIQTIETTKLHENPWNPNRLEGAKLDALRKMISEKGFVQPLVVRPHPDRDGEFEILDGAHRFRVMKELGKQEIECVVVSDEGKDAVLRTLAMNRLRGSEDPLALARTIADAAFKDKELCAYLAFEENEIAVMQELLSPPPEPDLTPEEIFSLLDFFLTVNEADYVKGILAQASKQELNGSDNIARAITKQRKNALALLAIIRRYEAGL